MYPQLPVPAVRVVEAVVLEAHAVDDHAPSSCLLENATRETVPLGGRQRDSQGGKTDNVGRGNEIPCLMAWCPTRRGSRRQAEGGLRARALEATVAMVTALDAPASRKRAIRSDGMPALSRKLR